MVQGGRGGAVLEIPRDTAGWRAPANPAVVPRREADHGARRAHARARGAARRHLAHVQRLQQREREAAARAVARDDHAARGACAAGAVLPRPSQRGHGVLHRRRRRVLGRQPIVDREHGQSARRLRRVKRGVSQTRSQQKGGGTRTTPHRQPRRGRPVDVGRAVPAVAAAVEEEDALRRIAALGHQPLRGAACLALAAPGRKPSRIGRQRDDAHTRSEALVEVALAAVARLAEAPDALGNHLVLLGRGWPIDAVLQECCHVFGARIRCVRLAQRFDRGGVGW
jgi:hypothetical protein